MEYVLYTIVFPNNKKYIGITTNLKKRIYKHRYRSMQQSFQHLPLYRAIVKFGFDNLKWEFKNYEDLQSLLNAEIEFIKRSNTTNNKYGYNCTAGGQGHLNYSPTQETREKLSRAHKGKKKTAQQKENISKAKIGSKNPMYGKKTSAKQKMIASIISSGSKNVHAKFTEKQVAEIRKKYKTGKYLIKDLCKEYNLSSSSMTDLLRNRSYIDPSYIP